jgi:hypothetical protein
MISRTIADAVAHAAAPRRLFSATSFTSVSGDPLRFRAK